MCGEIEKANGILKEHYESLSSEFSYYDAMKPRHSSSIQREINDALYQMEELKLLLQRFRQNDLMLELGIANESLVPLPG